MLRLKKIILMLSLFFGALFKTDAAIGTIESNPINDSKTIEERVEKIRTQLKEEALQVKTFAKSAEELDKTKHFWYNTFGNWGDWAKWRNWANWRNWTNFSNWWNY